MASDSLRQPVLTKTAWRNQSATISWSEGKSEAPSVAGRDDLRFSGTLVEVVREFAANGMAPTCDCDRRNSNALRWGAVAQLGERLVRNEEVSGSIPLSSTKYQ